MLCRAALEGALRTAMADLDLTSQQNCYGWAGALTNDAEEAAFSWHSFL